MEEVLYQKNIQSDRNCTNCGVWRVIVINTGLIWLIFIWDIPYLKKIWLFTQNRGGQIVGFCKSQGSKSLPMSKIKPLTPDKDCNKIM